MDKNRFQRLRTKFDNWKFKTKNKLRLIKELRFPLGRKIYVVGTPMYPNLGDSAIAVSEMNFLKQCVSGRARVVEVTYYDWYDYTRTVIRNIPKSALVCLMGGGNMGDVWFDAEGFHRQVRAELPKNRIIFFPQTIHYTETENGEKEKENSKKFWGNRKDLTLIAREKTSFDTMKELYGDTDIILTPDIVLSQSMEDLGAVRQERTGVLLCLRDDLERIIDEDDIETIKKYLDENRYEVKRIDMYADCNVTKENRADLVGRKMEEFGSSKLVVTDRLHGMVFAAVTGTPCIVFSNYNHKVLGTYEWIEHLTYIKFAGSVDEAIGSVSELYGMENCTFDNAPLREHFEKIKKRVEAWLR